MRRSAVRFRLWAMKTVDWKDFTRVELLVGTIVDVQMFPEAHKPAYKLKVDLGSELGTKWSSAQITSLYDPHDLKGKQVVCVVNLGPKQIGPFVSEVLVTGFMSDKGVVLCTPDRKVGYGCKLC